MSVRVKGRVAVVMGASSGVGRATAQALARRGEALSLVVPAGSSIVDDLAHQPEGAVPPGHHLAVEELVEDLESRPRWERLPLLDWPCGVFVMARR